ncbi:MAG: cytochrome c [Deltaproteobacteria bacterium]|jgi:cytochrome c6
MMRPVTIGLFTLSLLAGVGCKEDKAPETAKTTTAAKAPPAAPPAKAPPAAALSEEATKGKALFMTACANCHGPDGSGEMMRQMMPNIGNLTLASTHDKYDDAAIAQLITNGRGKMPAFGSVFKPDQVKQIIAYARTLKK